MCDGNYTVVCRLQKLPSGMRWGWFLVDADAALDATLDAAPEWASEEEKQQQRDDEFHSGRDPRD